MRGTKILLIDEATASIHKSLDKKIQEVLATEFKDCTIITIAHRLETVLDYDKIIVLQNGSLVEEGTPDELLQAKGEFYEMAQEAGI